MTSVFMDGGCTRGGVHVRAAAVEVKESGRWYDAVQGSASYSMGIKPQE